MSIPYMTMRGNWFDERARPLTSLWAVTKQRPLTFIKFPNEFGRRKRFFSYNLLSLDSLMFQGNYERWKKLVFIQWAHILRLFSRLMSLKIREISLLCHAVSNFFIDSWGGGIMSNWKPTTDEQSAMGLATALKLINPLEEVWSCQ